MKYERGLFELYNDDPERAERLLFGSRRNFLKLSAAVAAAIGAPMVFARNLPHGLMPIALAEAGTLTLTAIPGKEAMIVLNDRPLNAEPLAHQLDDEVTPATAMFVRNNGIVPTPGDPEGWRLTIVGEAAAREVTFSIKDLKRQFDHHTYQLQLECGGNGRAEFRPPVPGNQWRLGAIACPRWTGVRLNDVLDNVGIKPNARYIGYEAADLHLSGDPAKQAISRGVPMRKAFEDETLIAWAMNDQPIPSLHGGPLRLVAGGWPGSVSGKWLTRLLVRDREHDGAKMGGKSYRVPCEPVMAGADVPDSAMCIIESMPVKSLITFPESGITHDSNRPMALRGHAWAGDLAVQAIALSIDFGQTWQGAQLQPPANRLAWQRWHAQVRFPGSGYFEVWARATDSTGRSQPMVLPGWNPRGYLNNACHRLAVQVL